MLSGPSQCSNRAFRALNSFFSAIARRKLIPIQLALHAHLISAYGGFVMKTFARVSLLAVVALMALPSIAGAQTPILYGAASGSSSNLFTIDPATGATTVIGPIGIGVSSLAIDPRTGTL